MAKTAWGIELGTSSVKAVKLVADRGSATIEDIAIVALSDFGLGSGTSLEDARSGALNELRQSRGIKKGDQVIVSITGQNTLGRIISLPPVSKERVRETIENEAKSQIPIKLEEAVWDFQVIEDAGDEDELKVNLYAAKKEEVDKIVDCCENAGLQITGIQVAPLGIYNYIKYEMDDAVSDACVAIDIGADATEVVIIDGQKTYVRVLPVAGNDVTKALRARFKLSADDAEKLKRRAAKSKDAAAVFEAMKPPLKDMVGEIYRAVGFYKSQNEDANINQLVMMGNGSKLLNIKKFFEQQLQYQVHKVEAPARITPSRSVDPTELQENIQSLTVAIGLALQGCGVDGLNNVNLIPPSYLQGKALEKLRVPFFAGGGIAAAGGLVALLMAIFSTGGVSAVTTQAEAAAQRSKAQTGTFMAQQPAQDEEFKARSLLNVVQGVVLAIPATTTKDKDGNEVPVPGRNINMRAASVPGVLMRGVEDGLAEYTLKRDKSSDPRLYRANVKNSVAETPDALGVQFLNSAFWVVETPAYQGDQDGVGGFMTMTRTYTYKVYVASELTSSIDEATAHNNVRSALAATATKGFVVEKLRAALIAELKASGQLEGMSDDRIAKLEFPNLEVVVNDKSSQALVSKPEMMIADVLQHSERPFQEGPRSIKPRVELPTRFAVSEIRITLRLDPIAPPAESAEEPAGG